MGSEKLSRAEGHRTLVWLLRMRTVVPLPQAWRLLNHGPTVLISTAHAGRRNVMAAAWVMPIDFEPCAEGIGAASTQRMRRISALLPSQAPAAGSNANACRCSGRFVHSGVCAAGTKLTAN